MSFAAKIEKLVTGGNGLGRLPDGKVVLVPHVLPGEEVLVRPANTKKNYMEARVVEILHPSADRTNPPCPYFFRCGGCDFQHIRFEKQAEIKNRILLEQFERAGLMPAGKSFLLPPLFAPQPFHYRQRVRLHVGKNGELGFHRGRSHAVIPVVECLLARPQLNETLNYLLHASPFGRIAPPVNSVELLLSPAENLVVVLIHLARGLRPAERKVVEEIAVGGGNIKSVVVTATGSGVADIFQGGKSAGKEPLLCFTHPSPDGDILNMTIEPGGFCQVNAEQNERLVAHVVEWAGVDPDSRVLDLFCGMGNFSLPLARRAGSVTGMDLQRSAIRSALRNAASNGIRNCSFSQNGAFEGARSLAEGKEKFDVALLDPPRQGCAAVIPFLVELGVERIISISCDPATLCRDLLFFARNGYVIEKAKMVDMFPQTHHIETIVSLCRSPGATSR